MKKIFSLLTALLFTLLVFGQSSDEDAIRKVIMDETIAWNQCDAETWLAVRLQEDYIVTEHIWPNMPWKITGWEEHKSHIEKWLSPEYCTTIDYVPKYEFDIMIEGNMAYVTHTEPGMAWSKNITTSILKKVNGEWKLLKYSGFHHSLYEVHKTKGQLKQFSGKWKADISTFTQEPLQKRWAYTNMAFNASLTDTGMKIKFYSEWYNAMGDWDYDGTAHLSIKQGEKDLIVFERGINSADWTEARMGKATMEGDGKLVISYFNGWDPSKIAVKWTLQKMDDNTLQGTYEEMNEKGESTSVEKVMYHKI